MSATVADAPFAGGSRRMLFHRRFEGYSGGHGKVWDYFNHALALGFDARVHFAEGSTLGRGNPWAGVLERIEPTWCPQAADVLFIAGMDWDVVPAGLESTTPVVNLLQAVRHADVGSPLRAFLARRALRLCVAPAIAEAVRATGEAVGTIEVVPAAIDIAGTATAPAGSRCGVLIDGIKQPALAVAVAAALSADGIEVDLLLEHRPRGDYLRALAGAAIAVLLPLEREGFYLPALEAMALGTPVVTLDAIGNRAYLRDGANALVVAADGDALAAAARVLLTDPALAARLAAEGRHTARRHSPDGERAAFASALGTFLASRR